MERKTKQNYFEQKYNQIEDKKIKEFHNSRRMFAIYKDKLFLARKGVSYSHAVWFWKKGWISRTNEKLMKSIVRGIIDSKGDVYFYKGYDFKIDEKSEKIFFKHLKQLSKKMKLKLTTKLYGGYRKQKSNGRKTPKKYYGELKDIIKV